MLVLVSCNFSATVPDEVHAGVFPGGGKNEVFLSPFYRDIQYVRDSAGSF
jgi:hypothetical protein